jgi:hypothetical protein
VPGCRSVLHSGKGVHSTWLRSIFLPGLFVILDRVTRCQVVLALIKCTNKLWLRPQIVTICHISGHCIFETWTCVLSTSWRVTFAFSSKRSENAMVALAMRRTPLVGSQALKIGWNATLVTILCGMLVMLSL